MSGMTEALSYREASRELLRETVFRAAREKLEVRPWSEITMSDIAVGAGVSRQTLYNEFGNRDEFGLAFVMYEAGKFIDEVERSIRGRGQDPRGAVEVALERFLRLAAGDPVVATLLSDDGTGGMLPFVTTQGLPVISWVSERIGAVIVETWPGASEGDAKLIAESMVRLAISYITAPAGSIEETAASVGRLFGPFIDRVLTAA